MNSNTCMTFTGMTDSKLHQNSPKPSLQNSNSPLNYNSCLAMGIVKFLLLLVSRGLK